MVRDQLDEDDDRDLRPVEPGETREPPAAPRPLEGIAPEALEPPAPPEPLSAKLRPPPADVRN